MNRSETADAFKTIHEALMVCRDLAVGDANREAEVVSPAARYRLEKVQEALVLTRRGLEPGTAVVTHQDADKYATPKGTDKQHPIRETGLIPLARCSTSHSPFGDALLPRSVPPPAAKVVLGTARTPPSSTRGQ
jgi:hypothetical protein